MKGRWWRFFHPYEAAGDEIDRTTEAFFAQLTEARQERLAHYRELMEQNRQRRQRPK